MSIVSTRRCPDYQSIAPVLAQVLEDLGGMARFVQPGNTVLIKPNMLSAATPDEAKTTHPEVVRALIHEVRRAGGIPQVADSPGGVGILAKVWESTGFAALCASENVPLINLEKSGAETFILNGFSITIARPVLQADVLISVPKVKTHVLTTYTGAVKNMYGTVPGFQKTLLHKQYPEHDRFSAMLAALYGKVKPHLAIADGIVGMEGEGPSGGKPVLLGILAGSDDAAALDSICCTILGLPLKAVKHLHYVQEQKDGTIDLASITLKGDPPSSLAPAKFQKPGTLRYQLIPRWFIRMLSPLVWVRPRFNNCCIACGQCVRACPVGALSLTKGRPHPALEKSKCIECCCCHEVCPAKAIAMQNSFLLRLIWWLRKSR